MDIVKSISEKYNLKLDDVISVVSEALKQSQKGSKRKRFYNTKTNFSRRNRSNIDKTIVNEYIRASQTGITNTKSSYTVGSERKLTAKVTVTSFDSSVNKIITKTLKEISYRRGNILSDSDDDGPGETAKLLKYLLERKIVKKIINKSGSDDDGANVKFHRYKSQRNIRSGRKRRT